MAKGSQIIVSANPQGKFDECVISGTPKPGVCMEIVPGTALQGGRPTMRAVTRATGAKGPICVLLPDSMQGKLPTDAYVDGTRGFVYWPIAGEELNMLLGDVSGTGSVEDTAIGDLFGVETVTGKIIANSAYTATPFQSMEARHGFITADELLWTKFLGMSA